MKGALPYPIYGLKSLLPATVRWQTKGVWNPAMPPKYWADEAMDLPALVTYPYAVVAGTPGLETVEVRVMTLSRKWAQTANVPPSPCADPLEPEIPQPIRAVYEDERLAVGFGGVIQVQNTALYAQLTAGVPQPGPSIDLGQVIAKLDQIILMLRAAGVGG